MSKPRAYTEETLSIIARFFQTIDFLVSAKLMRGKATYCRLYNIDRRNFDAQSKNHSLGIFQVSWLLGLINDFRISAEWLMTGKGDMFKKDKSIVK